MEPNYVYVMRLADRVHKIGISCQPERRAVQITEQHGRLASVVYTWQRDADAASIEATAHRLLAAYLSDDFVSDEIFDVTAEVACCAVELALALKSDSVITIERNLPIKTNRMLTDLQNLPIKESFIGYLDGNNESFTDSVLAMRREGVKPQSVYTSWLACSKALRPGDALVIQRRDLAMVAETCVRKGVHVRVV